MKDRTIKQDIKQLNRTDTIRGWVFLIIISFLVGILWGLILFSGTVGL